MPTVYKFPRKSLPFNRPRARDIEIWKKHRASKGKSPKLPKHRDK